MNVLKDRLLTVIAIDKDGKPIDLSYSERIMRVANELVTNTTLADLVIDKKATQVKDALETVEKENQLKTTMNTLQDVGGNPTSIDDLDRGRLFRSNMLAGYNNTTRVCDY